MAPTECASSTYKYALYFFFNSMISGNLQRDPSILNVPIRTTDQVRTTSTCRHLRWWWEFSSTVDWFAVGLEWLHSAIVIPDLSYLREKREIHQPWSWLNNWWQQQKSRPAYLHSHYLLNGNSRRFDIADRENQYSDVIVQDRWSSRQSSRSLSLPL